MPNKCCVPMCKTGYASQSSNPEFMDTYLFVSLITKLSTVLNVKTSTSGKYKRDSTRDPILSCDDWKIDFLQEFVKFLNHWEKSQNVQLRLTNETLSAVRQTCSSLVELSKYLIDQCGFQYVLTGKLSSDPVEGRFGWYRQLSGANYYISVRQLFESERKIKTLSLLKFSGFTFNEIKTSFPSSLSADCATDSETINWFVEQLINKQADVDSTEGQVVYYCAGYVAKSVLSVTNCSSCKDLLQQDNYIDGIELTGSCDTLYDSDGFFEEVNRGGLRRPSDFLLMLSLKCYSIHKLIVSDKELLNMFTLSVNSRNLFCDITCAIAEQDPILDLCLPLYSSCEKGHCVLKLCIFRFFNILCKNFVNSTNNSHAPNDKDNLKRKQTKLSSGSCPSKLTIR